MACCRLPIDDDGYATPAALVLSLALALVGSALCARGLQTLNHAEADLERMRQEFALDGAQLTAATAVVRNGGPGPYAWVFSTDLGWVRAIAEPEADKLSPEAFAGVDDAVLHSLGVTDTAALKTRIAAIADAETPVDLSGLDPAPLWRDCGASLVSQFGARDAVQYLPHETPSPGAKPPAWHVGETWRIRIATPTGWRDDRIVRFTGDARRPVAIVARSLSKSEGDGGGCENLLISVAGG